MVYEVSITCDSIAKMWIMKNSNSSFFFILFFVSQFVAQGTDKRYTQTDSNRGQEQDVEFME